MLSFAQFGSDLDAATKAVIGHGARLTELLKQGQYSPMSVGEMVVSLFAAKNKFLRDIEVEQIKAFEEGLHNEIRTSHPEIFEEINAKGILSEELDARLREVIKAYVEKFKMLNGD